MREKMVQLLRRFQKQIQGFEFVGVDVFDDQTVQVYHEFSPRDAVDEACTAAEFLTGRLNDEVRKTLGEAKLKEILE